MKKARKLLRIIFGRTAFVVMSLLLQISILLAGFRFLSHYMVYIYGGFTLLSAFVILYVINKDENPSFKLAWIIPITVIPVFGTLLYLFLELQWEGKIINRRLRENIAATQPYLKQNPRYMEQLARISRSNANLAAYIENSGSYPVYGNTNVKYYPLGEEMFEDMKKELEKAKRFIFMEYFIVERGEMWDSILEILERKVSEGVEVRFMYDGMCCLVLLPYSYPKELRAKGLKAKMFAPIRPALSTYQNNRDHRKILVIDGHTAFTGGINLADEYINRKVRFGHWKDTGIMLKGDAVTSFTMMFLQMWNITEREPEDYGRYLRDPEFFYPPELSMEGFVIPYGDSPLDQETVGELVYLDIINTARSYVHIMTPYLILNYELVQALQFAAKRGVETIIIMPHIPDKVYAFLLAKAHYEELIKAGVQIYEYTPGFVHAKVFTSDDEKAVVGTINMDYRSLYLHFECAAYVYRNEVIQDVERDFRETLAQSQVITLEECRRYPWYKKLAGRALRLFAPLM
ncbi:MAG: cardiolipin synthase [Hungatella hathewayi]|uniref:cardiolipin synthase n=1 Tax=Hungatella TaxID=1649459 RepID=UPI0011057CB2|nr:MULTISPECIES: cardiolipin synthase [Hungatella]MCI7380708.1 cardiolipin synthase [Hungatella sp.]MDY6235702.1 cardiolipin synthase [Hungatella hathewayi]